jgi:hypothetical protein
VADHHTDLQLSRDEWQQIDYLICITQPFYQYTTALSKTKGITIHMVFSIYNRLFEHLESRQRQLCHKKILWKRQMLQALDKARDKLKDYYSATDTPGLINIYTNGTILAPQYKLEFFQTPEWQDKDFAGEYKAALEQQILAYEVQLHDTCSQSEGPSYPQPVQEIEILLDSYRARPAVPLSELHQYLKGGKYSPKTQFQYIPL